MFRLVVDTNLWVRALLGGRTALPVLRAFREHRFQTISSEETLAELAEVARRPRLQSRIAPGDLQDLLEQLRARSMLVALETAPPGCRDPKDYPILATAIDGQADAIVSADGDLRADDALRSALLALGVQLWGVEKFVEQIAAVGDGT